MGLRLEIRSLEPVFNPTLFLEIRGEGVSKCITKLAKARKWENGMYLGIGN